MNKLAYFNTTMTIITATTIAATISKMGIMAPTAAPTELDVSVGVIVLDGVIDTVCVADVLEMTTLNNYLSYDSHKISYLL